MRTTTSPYLPATTGPLRRVVIVGNSGAGKTTFAARLAALLEVPHVELDALHHGPGWNEQPDEVMRVSVAAAVSGDGWVADGNYSVVRDLVWPRAQVLVWIDPPLPVVLGRLTRRTLGRWWRREQLWGYAGTTESLRTHFASRDSLYLWVLTTHRSRRRQYRAVMASNDYPDLRIVRLSSAQQTESWLASVAREMSDT